MDGAARSGTASVRIVSYNIHGLGDDRAALNEVVRGLSPDVVVVQEAPRRVRWRARCAEIAHSWGMLYAAGGLPALGNLIVVSHRIRVREAWCVKFPLTPGRHMRGAALVHCAVGGAAFTVVGTHLSTDDRERVTQAQRLNDEIAGIEGPLIVAGDLNETSSGESWRALASGLVDLGAAADTPTFSTRNPNRRIDAIFTSGDLLVRAFKVPATAATRVASDHLPLVADLVIRSA